MWARVGNLGRPCQGRATLTTTITTGYTSVHIWFLLVTSPYENLRLSGSATPRSQAAKHKSTCLPPPQAEVYHGRSA